MMVRHSPEQIDTWLQGYGFEFVRSLVFPILMDRERTRSMPAQAYLARKMANSETERRSIIDAQTAGRASGFCSTACQSSGRRDYAALSQLRGKHETGWHSSDGSGSPCRRSGAGNDHQAVS
jgi:hypothetical protein